MFGLLLWVIQVVNLNRGKENNVMYVEQGQEFYYGGLAIQADEFLLLDSDEAISWDDIFSVIGEGFVCRGWGSAYNPYMGAKLNKFYGEQLDTGKKQDIWIATTMSRACFREKTWENLSDMEFEYVVSLYPDAVRIRLKTGGIMEERAYETSD